MQKPITIPGSLPRRKRARAFQICSSPLMRSCREIHWFDLNSGFQFPMAAIFPSFMPADASSTQKSRTASSCWMPSCPNRLLAAWRTLPRRIQQPAPEKIVRKPESAGTKSAKTPGGKRGIALRSSIQPSYFQRYMWKSLWKKRPDSGQRPEVFAREVPRPPFSNSRQALHFQYGTGCSSIGWLFPPPNRTALSFSHLLHSLPPRGWLRVTRNRICIVHKTWAPKTDAHQIDFRIVPLTCPGSRTILAASTREAVGERPRLFFRE